MQFLRSLFTGGQKVVVADLAEPYRDLMQTQTLPVVRGVLVHAIAVSFPRKFVFQEMGYNAPENWKETGS